jgi:hypothetical protein
MRQSIASAGSPLTTAYATCALHGQRVQLYAFAAPSMAKAFLDSVKGYGVTADKLVQGDGWMVAPTDPTQLPAIRAALA